MSAGRKELGPGGRKEASESTQASKDFSRKAESLMVRETFVGVKLGRKYIVLDTSFQEKDTKAPSSRGHSSLKAPHDLAYPRHPLFSHPMA